MGGLWKLAAMSAVIGAGLVIVYQAQQGVRAVPSANATPEESGAAATAPELSNDTNETQSAEPVVKLAALQQPLTFGAPATKPAATASVPRENPRDREAGPALDGSTTTPSARYQRGVNFKQRAPADEPTTAEFEDSASQQPTVADDDPFAAHNNQPTRAASQPLRLTPDEAAVNSSAAELRTESIESEIILTGGKSVEPARQESEPAAESDPFANTAPPTFNPSPKVETAPRRVFDPQPTIKESAPPPRERGPVVDDPFANTNPSRQDRETVRTPARSKSEQENPQIELGAPASLPTRRRLPPLPIDLDDPANVPQQSTPAMQDQPRSSGRGLSPLTAAADKDPLLGDGLISADAPRGVQEPRLTIEKIAPSKAALGQDLVYAVVVKNVGGSPASQVVVEDRIPKGARLIGTHPRAELLDKRLIWKLGTLQPNDERKISIKVVPEEEGPLGSVAKVNFVSEVAAEIVITAPQLKLRVSSPASAVMGETVKFVFTVSNTGEGAAANVVLRSVLPEGLKHPAGNDLEYNIGDLPPKQSRDVVLELTAAKPGRITQHASVTGGGNASADAVAILEVQGEQLVLTRRGQSRVFVGRPSVFVNQVLNEGEKTVQRVKVTEVIPAGFEFVEATDGGRFDQETRTISWVVGPLSPGAEQAVSTKLMPKAPGQFEGAVTAAGPSGSVATVKAQVAVEGFPSLTIERLGDERVLSVGERLTSQVQLRNSGTAAASRVGLAIDVPAELRILAAKGPAAYRVIDQRVVFDPIGELPPRDRATYEVVMEALAPGDARLELQIAADHLKRPVRHEEAVQIVGDGQ